jgi:hypothetical protein
VKKWQENRKIDSKMAKIGFKTAQNRWENINKKRPRKGKKKKKKKKKRRFFELEKVRKKHQQTQIPYNFHP